MLRIFITRQSRYPADIKMLKAKVLGILKEHGVTSAEVSVALVGERKMKELARKHLGEKDGLHEVLSFPFITAFKKTPSFQLGDELNADMSSSFRGNPALQSGEDVIGNDIKTDFPEHPEGLLQLGEVVVCYPYARRIAIRRNRMMDEVIGELVEHGVLHLLGKHHE